MTDLEQHNIEIHENAGHWERKPLLRAVYHRFYQLIARQLTHEVSGDTLEVGSGLGKIKEVIPNCLTSDLFPNPWLDRTENVYRLSQPNASLSNLILFDVWHHLEFPGLALQESFRVLKPAGRLIIFEPAASLLGRFIYGNFHHEPLGMEQELPWLPTSEKEFCERYYAAQGNAWRMVRSKDFPKWTKGWRLIEEHYNSALAYLGSGGFRGRQLYPRFLFDVVNRVDSQLSKWPNVFATRMLIVLEKE